MLILPLTLLALHATDISSGMAARLPDAKQLAAYHELLASEPHVAGTAGDARTIERIAAEFRTMGLEVEVQEFFPLLTRPVRARLEIVGLDDASNATGARRGILSLGVTEPNLAIDPATAHPDLDIAWNAWSGSGIAQAGVIYVNYGRREDFAKLSELGIDPKGKIALARYGGNFRGYKAQFAQDAGCVGLVIFTDPADSGSGKGKTWPEGGGWANAECVQRGSLITLPYVGDPLTPFRTATKDAERLAIDAVDLPKIPVQPIGYGAAQQILVRMHGAPSPKEWHGGLAAPYALDDATLQLRIEVEQTREIMRTANIIARLPGAVRPLEEVIIGAHHDAWCFGAADPLAGTICMLECARDFAALAKAGSPPDRTLVFCAWGAEEYGIFGSSEFVERGVDALAARAVAYINLDMAAMGINPGGAVSPTLRTTMTKALTNAPDASGTKSALDVWAKSPTGTPMYGDLGGGSDHVAFWCHAGVPSISLSAGGSEGSSYHSNYDTVAWYRATVGADYAAAKLVTGIVNAMVAELSDARSEHVSATALVEDCVHQAAQLRTLAAKRGLPVLEFEQLEAAFTPLLAVAARVDARVASAPRSTDAQQLDRLCTLWISPGGLPARPWFRNLYAATDRYSGYATEPWPLLREAIEDAQVDATSPPSIHLDATVSAALATYLGLARDLNQALTDLDAPTASPE